MPIYNLGNGVVLVPSAASITVHRHLCAATTAEDAEYLRTLDPKRVTAVNVYAYDPEWAVEFSDGKSLDLGVRYGARFAGSANTLRGIIYRAVYLAKCRAAGGVSD